MRTHGAGVTVVGGASSPLLAMHTTGVRIAFDPYDGGVVVSLG
jgi:hypothetical protein